MTTSQMQERARSARKQNDGPRRREIVDVAGRCFAELGYDATTVESITKRSDVSRATFYAYFSSKDEVFRAVTNQVCEQFLDAQHVEGPTTDDLRQVLRTTTGAFIGAVFSIGDLLGLIEHRARLDPEVGASWSAVCTRLITRYVRFIERINETCDVTPCADPATVAQLLADAQLVGAARVASASDQKRAQYITDMIAMSERLIGFEVSSPTR